MVKFVFLIAIFVDFFHYLKKEIENKNLSVFICHLRLFHCRIVDSLISIHLWRFPDLPDQKYRDNFTTHQNIRHRLLTIDKRSHLRLIADQTIEYFTYSNIFSNESFFFIFQDIYTVYMLTLLASLTF